MKGKNHRSRSVSPPRHVAGSGEPAEREARRRVTRQHPRSRSVSPEPQPGPSQTPSHGESDNQPDSELLQSLRQAVSTAKIAKERAAVAEAALEAANRRSADRIREIMQDRDRAVHQANTQALLAREKAVKTSDSVGKLSAELADMREALAQQETSLASQWQGRLDDSDRDWCQKIKEIEKAHHNIR